MRLPKMVDNLPKTALLEGALCVMFYQVNFDGVLSNDLGTPNVFSSATSMDAIEEVIIMLSACQAEYAGNGGAVVNVVSKSGDREYHGTGYWYKLHEMFKANDFFNNRTAGDRPVYRYNTLGGTLGGPIHIPGKFNKNKDKLVGRYRMPELVMFMQVGVVRTRAVLTRLEFCDRRLDPSLLGFEILGKGFEPRTTLPKEVKVAGLGIPMVLVPPGEGDIGADYLADSKPVHTVRVEAFYLGKFELTQAEWKLLMGTSPSAHQGEGFSDAARMPVEGVSWNDCQALIQKLNERVPGGGFRLPTEEEWEYAARAGSSGPFQAKGLASVAWFRENSGRRSDPGGEFLAIDAYAPRPVGLGSRTDGGYTTCREMSGNGPPAPLCRTSGRLWAASLPLSLVFVCSAAEDLPIPPRPLIAPCGTGNAPIGAIAGMGCAWHVVCPAGRRPAAERRSNMLIVSLRQPVDSDQVRQQCVLPAEICASHCRTRRCSAISDCRERNRP